MSHPLIDSLTAIVGQAGIRTKDSETEGYLTDWHGQYRGQALAVVLPENTEQVSAVMKLADEHDLAVVPQGGNTVGLWEVQHQTVPAGPFSFPYAA